MKIFPFFLRASPFLLTLLISACNCDNLPESLQLNLAPPLETPPPKCEALAGLGVFVVSPFDPSFSGEAPDNPADLGKSWKYAFTTIQDAIDNLPPEGGRVFVSEGTYSEPVNLKDKRNITIEGGYQVGDKCRIKPQELKNERRGIISQEGLAEPMLLITEGSRDIFLFGLTFLARNMGNDNNHSIEVRDSHDVIFSSCQFSTVAEDNQVGNGFYVSKTEGFDIVNASFAPSPNNNFMKCLRIADGSSINLNKVHFSKCKIEQKAGGALSISRSHKVNLTNLSISDSQAVGKKVFSEGDSVWVNGGGLATNQVFDLFIQGLELVGNFANGDGGGAYILDSEGDVKIKLGNSQISHNSSEKGKGGAFYFDANNKSNIMIEGGIFEENKAKEDGGALAFTQNGKITVSQGSYKANQASAGGAIFLHKNQGLLTLVGNRFENNKGLEGGGALVMMKQVATGAPDATHVEMLENIFISNMAGNLENDGVTIKDTGYGGAVVLYNSAVNIKLSGNFRKNQATGLGGALAIDGYSKILNVDIVEPSLFKENVSFQSYGGGAIYFATKTQEADASKLSIQTGFIFENNSTHGESYASDIRVSSHEFFLDPVGSDMSLKEDEKTYESVAVNERFLKLGPEVGLGYEPNINESTIVVKQPK